jgi:glycosyltransferase involved in cell wall biosynthesis
MKPFSVVIPTHSNLRLKKGIVRDVVSTLEPAADYIQEVILVDTSPIREALESADGWLTKTSVRLIHSEVKGSSAARNVGVQQAVSDFVILLDDDMLFAYKPILSVSKQITDELVYAFPERRYLPLDISWNDLHRAILEEDLKWLCATSFPCPGRPKCDKASDIMYRICSISCFSVIPRRLYIDIGGFDEAFKGWGLQDTEFLSRLIKCIPIYSLFEKHTLFHVDHYVTPYKYIDQSKNLALFKSRLASRNQSFDYYEYVNSTINCDGVNYLSCQKCGLRGLRV